ncbi:hypothetical protein PAXRUDRAFT_142261, partial [Paxillus rubicundulus Ve08.2h10]
EWRYNCIEMHVKFWTTLENHPWCHSHSKYSAEALLCCQGQQRHCWHQLVTTPKAFSLAELQQELINQTCEHLMHQDKLNEIQKLNSVCTPCSSHYNPHTNSPPSFHLTNPTCNLPLFLLNDFPFVWHLSKPLN